MPARLEDRLAKQRVPSAKLGARSPSAHLLQADGPSLKEIIMAEKSSARAERRPGAGDSDRVTRVVREAITVGEIFSVGVLNLVRHTLVTAVAGARDVGGEIGLAATTAVRGSIRAAAEVGGDLGMVAKQAIKGTVEATSEIGGDLAQVARVTVRGAVKTADELGGDVGKVATRAVEGVIEAARDLGADVGSLARSAAEGAIEAADRIGSSAGRTVRSTLSQAASGVRSLIGELAAGRNAADSGPASRAQGATPGTSPRDRTGQTRRRRRKTSAP
jgi:hypothetical protein